MRPADGQHHRIAAWPAGGANDQVGDPGGAVGGTDPAFGAVEELRGRRRGVDHRDFHARSAQLAAQGVGQADDRVLGRRVNGRVRIGSESDDRGDVDDDSAAGGEHAGQGRLGGPDQPDQVGVDQRADLVLRHLVQPALPAQAGVVDQDVDPVVVPQGAGDEGAGVGAAPHVCPPEHDRRGARLAAALGDVLEPVQAAGADRQASVPAGEGEGGRRADPAGGAGHENRGVAEA